MSSCEFVDVYRDVLRKKYSFVTGNPIVPFKTALTISNSSSSNSLPATINANRIHESKLVEDFLLTNIHV